RADSFVVETNIHYPTESSLIGDGMRKIIPLGVELAQAIGAYGWRQSQHLLNRIKQQVRTIAQISASKSPKVKAGLPAAYQKLLNRAGLILRRAQSLQNEAETEGASLEVMCLSGELTHWMKLTKQVCETAS